MQCLANMFSPEHKCTFVAVYTALACAQPRLLADFDSFQKFYQVLVYGDSEHKSIFDRPHPMFSAHPSWREYLRNFVLSGKGSAPILIFDLLSKYFGVSIVLHFEYEANRHELLAASWCLGFDESIDINVQEKHALYVPKNEREKKICSSIEEKLQIKMEMAEEFQAREQIAKMLDQDIDEDIDWYDSLLESFQNI